MLVRFTSNEWIEDQGFEAWYALTLISTLTQAPLPVLFARLQCDHLEM